MSFTATVELHSLKMALSSMPEYKDLSVFPGPLIAGRTHKGEVIKFCQNKIHDAKHDKKIGKKEFLLIS